MDHIRNKLFFSVTEPHYSAETFLPTDIVVFLFSKNQQFIIIIFLERIKKEHFRKNLEFYEKNTLLLHTRIITSIIPYGSVNKNIAA